jgi:hypothetical protein
MCRDDGAERRPERERGVAAAAARALRCRTCGNEVSGEDAVFAPDGASPVRVFSNPQGLLCEILTLRWAKGVVDVGPRTSELTWFAGYTWQVVCCHECSSHLGWHYARVDRDVEPGEFWGLLTREILWEAGA